MDWSFSNLSELHQKFGWEEYVVLFVTLFISVLIGVYWAYRGQNTTSEFLMASKQMTLFPTTMSLACRYEKFVTFLLLKVLHSKESALTYLCIYCTISNLAQLACWAKIQNGAKSASVNLTS